MYLSFLACRSGTVLSSSGTEFDAPSGSEASPGSEADPGSDVETSGTEPNPSEPEDEADAVFDLSAVHRIDLTMAPADWLEVRDNPGTEAWYPADFSWDGESLSNIGVRAFGQGSVVAGKPPLKLDFDRYEDGVEWRGLEQLKLDSSVQDAGFLNEAVGTRVLREMGLPAARTGWAQVYVNGTLAGLFIVLESVDDQFVKRWFGDDDGPLYGTVTWRYGQGLNPITSGTVLDWYEPQTSLGGDGSEILAAIEAVASGTDEDVEAALDLDLFTRIAVTRSAMGAIDQFAADGNNFYLYVDDGRIVPIAWDLDADLGYPDYFTNALQMDLEQPWLLSHARYNPVTGAVYSDPVHARAVAAGWDIDGWLDDLLGGPLDWTVLDSQVAGYAQVLHEAACSDTYIACSSYEHRVVDLRFFLHTRLSHLAGAEVADCDAAPAWTATVEEGAATVGATAWGPGFMIGGQHFCHGIYAPAPSRIALTVQSGTLSGAAGVHDQNRNVSAGVQFSIHQDGAVLWEDTVDAYETASPFSVSVASGTVTLVATGSDPWYDGASWVNLEVP